MTKFPKTFAAGAATLVVSALLLTGCGTGDSASTAGASADTLTIGVSVYDMSSFVTEGKEGIDVYASENNLEIVWKSAGLDVSAQAADIDGFIEAEVDAIVLIPVQADSLHDQVAAAKAAGIPIFDMNASLQSKDLTGSIQPDDVAAGEQEAQMMFDALGGSGSVVVLQGPLGGSGEINRGKGIDNVLANSGITILAKDTANWRRDEAAAKVTEWIAAYGSEIDGVIAQNDDMGLGAL